MRFTERAALVGLLMAGTLSMAAPGAEKSGVMINGFETGEDLQLWKTNGCKAELVEDHGLNDSRAARITYQPGEGFRTFMLENWKQKIDLSSCNHLLLDVRAPEQMTFTLKLKSNRGEQQWYEQYSAGPEASTISVHLGQTGIDRSAIDYINLFTYNPKQPLVLFVDEIRGEMIRQHQTGPAEAEEVLISDFEDQADLDKWETNGVRAELSDEHVTRGKSSAKLTYLPGKGFQTFMLLPHKPGLDLSSCTHLLIDCYAPVNLQIALKMKSNQGKEVWQRDYSLEPAPWIISVPLEKTGLDASSIDYINLWLHNTRQETVLFIDNVRGGQGGAEARPKLPKKKEKPDPELF